MGKNFYSVKELAVATGYSRAWIAHLVKVGRLKSDRAGRDYVFLRKNVAKFLAKKKDAKNPALNQVFPRLKKRKK